MRIVKYHYGTRIGIDNGVAGAIIRDLGVFHLSEPIMLAGGVTESEKVDSEQER